MTSIVAALGAGALGLSLAGFGPGVGASFTDSDTAHASINVGTFGCALSSSDPDVTISPDGHTATVALGTINSSASGSESASVTVTNTGSIPLVVHWTEATTGNILGGTGAISAIPAAGDKDLPPGAADAAAIGFNWDELGNSDLGRSGTATYTASCAETPAAPAGISLFAQDGGVAYWYGQDAVLDLPQGVADSASAGVELTTVSPTLPAEEPTFVTDSYSTGSPRLDIKLSDGTYIFGYPEQGGNTWNLPGSGAPKTWADVEAYVTSNTLTVSQVFIVLDTSGGTSVVAHISSLQYGGADLIG
jgi:hypothetical protein